MGSTKTALLALGAACSVTAASAQYGPFASEQRVEGLVIAQEPRQVQEFEMTMNVFPKGRFSPDPLTVKKGIPVRLRMRALQREHLNQISIRPFVTNVTLEPPDKVTVIEFIPNQAGTFRIRNLGHDFEGKLIVAD